VAPGMGVGSAVLTADGEKDKAWGNETIRWNPDERWLEIKLPAPLAQLANRPHGRYRLSCPVTFPYQGERVAAQAATGAVRYDITRDPASGRWHLHASWKRVATVPPALDELRHHPVVAIDINDAHLDVAVIAPTAISARHRSRSIWCWRACPPAPATGGCAR
jgi:hypothetical protein